MNRRNPTSLGARIALASAMILSLVALSNASPAASAAQTAGTPVLTPAEVQSAMSASGPVVAHSPNVQVQDVSAQVATRVPGAPAKLWKVTVAGDFPPRAERYELLADGTAIAYGIPSPDGSSLIAATADPSVLAATLTTRYGTGSASTATDTSPSVTKATSANIAATTVRTSTGPLAVSRAVYNLGDEVYTPPGLPGAVEVAGDVHYPTDMSGGPYPLVIFMHGNHLTCYKGTHVDYTWPCPAGWSSLPNYEGYDYIARNLASYGYIVVSISANGVNVLGNETPDTGMVQRGDLIVHHISLWNDWNQGSGGPFGSTFVGHIDMSRIGVMGHSRGGEGAVYAPIQDAQRAIPFGIDAVLALAPVDFTRAVIPNIPFAVVLPYCDGDVSDLQGVHFFDDSRYLVPGDPAPKDTVTVMGANHDYFNTVWTPGGPYPGGWDDGKYSGCTTRLKPVQERRVGVAYISGFFRRYLGGDMSLDPMWTGAATPASIAPAVTLVSYLAGDQPATRLDVDRFTAAADITTDSLGGAVTASGLSLSSWCSDTKGSYCVRGPDRWVDIHRTGLAQGLFGWLTRIGSVNFSLNGGRDVSAYDDFQFRVAVNPRFLGNAGYPYQGLSVRITDGSGNSAIVSASSAGKGPLAYPINSAGSGHMILNQLRFPLGMFSGVDMTDVTSVDLVFSRTNSGMVDVADVAFSRGGV